MIARDTLLSRMRRLLADEDARTYSDYELVRAVDDGLEWLSRHLALQGSDLTTESVMLQSGDALPDDFVTLCSVFDADGRQLICLRAGLPITCGTYRIEGGILHTEGRAAVTYQKRLPALGENSSLDLPTTLTDTVAKVGVLMLAGADASSCAKALAEDDLLFARRHRSRRTAAMPWRI